MDEQRSRIMRAVKSRNTQPEMTVRRLVHSMGYRYRLHRKDLPGKPDLAFISRHKAIFVHARTENESGLLDSQDCENP